jgi:hypothetical protein
MNLNKLNRLNDKALNEANKETDTVPSFDRYADYESDLSLGCLRWVFSALLVAVVIVFLIIVKSCIN